MSAGSERCTKSSVPFWITSYVFEKRGRSPQVITSARDCPHLEIPIDFALYPLQFSILFKNFQKISEVGQFQFSVPLPY